MSNDNPKYGKFGLPNTEACRKINGEHYGRIVTLIREAIGEQNVSIAPMNEPNCTQHTTDENEVVVKAAGLSHPTGQVWAFMNPNNTNSFKWLKSVQRSGYEIADIAQLSGHSATDTVMVRLDIPESLSDDN